MSPILFTRRHFLLYIPDQASFTCIADKVTTYEGCTQGGELLPSNSLPPPNQNSKNSDLTDTMISKVLHDLPFSQNQPLKSVNNRY
jgi:hypothetical protein